MTARAFALALALIAPAPFAAAQTIDAMRSRVEFDVRTRLGTRVHGRFPVIEGRVDTLPDGRHRVRIRLAATAVEVGGSARNTALARGPQLFDAARHPWIEFESAPYAPSIARSGGALPGTLRLRGVSRGERFDLQPSACDTPGRGCPVVALGRVSRDDYGLSGWRWALSDRVRFSLHVHLQD